MTTTPDHRSPGARLRDWCLEEGFLSLGSEALVTGLVGALHDAGIPVHRINFTLRTLHPVLAAVGWVWEDGRGFQENRYRHVGKDDEAYQRSPVKPLLEQEATWIRVPLEGDELDRYPIAKDLHGRGFTDYLALALLAGDRLPNVLSVATKAPGGFTDGCLEVLQEAMPAVRAIVDRHATRLISESICATYIGPHTGRRVLEGNIQRGSIERLRAAVWFCDIRRFTERSLALGIEGTVALLNDTFGVIGEAVQDQDGEILKFIGDAALVVFPCREGDDRSACERALACALTVQRGLEQLPGYVDDPVGLGVGLHIGEVAYGNIGAAQRLDFTVIGHAVNLASRLESLCSGLGEPVLASADFRDAVDQELRAVGSFALKGVPVPVEVFAADAG